jgi:hypothetical protein
MKGSKLFARMIYPTDRKQRAVLSEQRLCVGNAEIQDGMII